MAEQQEGRWVTLDNGTHLFIKKGQTLDDAIATLGNGKEKGIESLKEKGWEYKNKNGNMRYNKGNVSVFQNATGKFVASYEETKNGVKETNSRLFNTLDEALKFTDEHKDFDDDYDFENWDDYKPHGDQGFGGINSDYDFVNKTYNMNVEKLASDFMKEKYPNGFPDFAGDLIYSEKYWNEFEDWAKKEKGIDFEKKSSTADLLGENENKKTVGEDLTNYYNEAFYKQHAGDRDEFIQHNIRRFGIPKGSTRKKEEEYYGKEYDKMHKKSGD